jgi:hypothetical protein
LCSNRPCRDAPQPARQKRQPQREGTRSGAWGRCSYTDTRTRAKLLAMAYCIHCGSQIADGSRFCPSCGRPQSPGGAIAAEPPARLDYTIQGDNLQVARVRLQGGQEVYAEAGKMVYKTANVHWDTRMSGATLGQKLMGALRRTVTGKSLFLTYFRGDGTGEVGFAGNYPGRIQLYATRRRHHDRAIRRRGLLPGYAHRTRTSRDSEHDAEQITPRTRA